MIVIMLFSAIYLFIFSPGKCEISSLRSFHSFSSSKFPTHGTLLSSKNDYSGFASIVKRNHMTTPYLGTFTTHCFNLILGYILVNHQMPYVFHSSLLLLHPVIYSRRMYASTWLERLFQSCQRKSNKNALNDDQPSTNRHRLLNYEELPNFGNDALVCENWEKVRIICD